jgi:hypothetical protein
MFQPNKGLKKRMNQYLKKLVHPLSKLFIVKR